MAYPQAPIRCPACGTLCRLAADYYRHVNAECKMRR